MPSNGFFPGPLSNDSSDRLNHKWVLLLMLLLALVTFIVPLHPDYNHHNNPNTNPPSSNSIVQSEPIEERIPTYTTVCWTPAQFTASYAMYASSYCSSQYNAAIRGQNDTSVYRLLMNDPIPSDKGDLPTIKPFVPKRLEQSKAKQVPQTQIQDEDLNHKVAKLVTFQVPVTLLLVAVGLGLSQAIWGVLSELFGSFNMEATLSAVGGEGTLMDASSRSQMYEDMAHSLTDATRKSPRTLSALYLIKKASSIVFVLVLALFLLLHSLPEVDNIRKDVSSRSSSSSSSSSNNNNNQIDNQKTPNANPTPVTANDSKGTDPFLCDFEIRSLQNVERFTLQCIPVKQPDNDPQANNAYRTTSSASAPSSSPSTPSSASSSTKSMTNVLDFEEMMLKIAFSLLILLLVVNVFSLCTWTCRLMSKETRSAFSLRDGIPSDVILLLQMAHLNASVHVARMLARGFGAAKV